MKKQFFYAALAIGMMSSCSSNDLPGNQAPEEQLPEEERVAIELGISSPNAKIEASTKGIGSVGGTGDASDPNNWNGETLGVWMYKVTDDQGTTTEVPAPENESDTTYIFNGLTFKAPTGTNEGKIQMIKEPATPIYQVKYYPSKGAYSFYGYHLGGATGTEDIDNKKIEAIQIDGTHDIMAAGTLEVTQNNYGSVAHNPGGAAGTISDDWDKIAKQSFSAWSARRGIQPTLVFEHKLARLRFFVKAGDDKASTHKWDAGTSTWIPRDEVPVSDGASGTVSVTQAVKINSIKVNGLAEKVDMTLEKGSDGKIVALTANTAATRTTPFTLKQKATSANPGDTLVALEAVAPKCWEDPTSGANSETAGYEVKKQVGESIMFLPEAGTTDSQLDIEIGVSQAVLDTYQAGETNKTYIVKSDILKTTLYANTISGGTANFLAGNNYDIIITVYSYSKIEITAQLTAWGAGGSITTAPGDEF